MRNGQWHDGWNGGSAWWMALMMIVVVALIAGTIIFLSRRVSGPLQRPEVAPIAGQPSPQAILAERFARGEIEPEEYKSRLSVLLAAPPS